MYFRIAGEQFTDYTYYYIFLTQIRDAQQSHKVVLST